MAASCLSALSIPFPRTTKSFHPFSFRCSFPSKHTFPLNSHCRPSPAVSAAATTSGSIEVDVSTVSATPSKPLPFRVRLMHEAGYDIGNLDATLKLQRPKLSPHKDAVKANLSALLGADPSVVNLKAKTNERVDSLGENRRIAAHTLVLLMRE